MNKKILFSFLLLGIIVLAGAGCGGDESQAPGEESAVEQTGETGDSGEGASSLESVLAKAQNLGGYKFDVLVTQANYSDMEYTMWVKEGNIRWEGFAEGQNLTYILNGSDQTAYIHIPSQGAAIKYNFSAAKEAVGKSPSDQASSIAQMNTEILGNEVWDGKDCLVVKNVSSSGDETKWWIWAEYGIPVKTRILSSEGEVIVTELRNIEFSVSDDLFSLPEDVEIMQYPSF